MSNYKNYLIVNKNSPHPKKLDLCLTNIGKSGARSTMGFVMCTEAPTGRPKDFPTKTQRDQLYQLVGNDDTKTYKIKSGDGKCLDPEGWLNTQAGEDLRKYKSTLKRAPCESGNGPNWQHLPDGKLMNTNSGYGGRGNVRGCLQIPPEKTILGYYKATMVPCDVATSTFKLPDAEEHNDPKADTMIRVTSLGNPHIKDYCLETDGDAIIATQCLTKWREVPGEKEQSYQVFSFSGTKTMRDNAGQCYGIDSLGYNPDDFVWPSAKECGHSKLKGSAWAIDDSGKFKSIDTGPNGGNVGIIENEQDKNKDLKLVDQCLDIDESSTAKAQYDTRMVDCADSTAKYEYTTPTEYEKLYPSPAVVAERNRQTQMAINKAVIEKKGRMNKFYGGLLVSAIFALMGLYFMFKGQPKPKYRSYPRMSQNYYRR